MACLIEWWKNTERELEVGMMQEILQYEFMRHALYAAVLASVACGVVGSYVVVKRLVSVSGGISHSAFGGVGLGYFLGVNPLVMVVPFTLICALGIGWVSRRTRLPADTAIGIFWAFGMAFGVMMINLSPGYAPDLFTYLFGSILTVPHADLLAMLLLDIFIIGFVYALYKEFLAIAYDEEYAEAAGLRVQLLYQVLLCLIALTVVVLIRVVGIILVIALLTIPSAIAKRYTRSLSTMMGLSIVLGVCFTVLGLLMSYWLNLASGATIILLASFAMLVSETVQVFLERAKIKRPFI